MPWVARRTLSKVKSRAIKPRHPDVPNLMEEVIIVVEVPDRPEAGQIPIPSLPTTTEATRVPKAKPMATKARIRTGTYCRNCESSMDQSKKALDVLASANADGPRTPFPGDGC